MSSKFGWSYPPGAANDPNAPWNQDDGCVICGEPSEACICPECPVCSEHGNPCCYEPDHDLDGVQHVCETTENHGMKLTRQQRIGATRIRIAGLKDAIEGEQMYIAHMEEEIAAEKEKSGD